MAKRRRSDVSNAKAVEPRHVREPVQEILEQARKRADAGEERGRAALDAALRSRRILEVNRVVGELGKARYLNLIHDIPARMSREPFRLQPSVHTFSNIINTCVRCGDLPLARRTVEQMAEQFGVRPNQVTLTALLKGEAQAPVRSMSSAMEVFQRLCDEHAGLKLDTNLRTINTMLRGCVRMCDMRAAKSLMKLVKQIWKTGQQQDAQAEVDLGFGAAFEYYIKVLCYNARPRRAHKVLRKMQRRHIASPTPPMLCELACAYALLGNVAASRSVLSLAAGRAATPAAQGSRPTDSLQLFNRLRDQQADISLMRVERFLNDSSLGSRERSSIAAQVERGGFWSHPRVILDDDEDNEFSELPPLKFHKLFGDRKAVKVEICSGHGDWVTSRARADASTGESICNWVAVEMRLDRVYQTWAKALLDGVRNLAVLGGTAQRMLRRMQNHSVAEVFVNFPDPPPPYLQENKLVLLDAAFMQQVLRVLQPGGVLTIVTDDALYAGCAEDQLRKVLLEAQANARIAHVAEGIEPFVVLTAQRAGQENEEEGRTEGGHDTPTAREGAAALSSRSFFSGDLPHDYGNSYFDSMWKNGNRTRRFFMQIQKK
ncbi:tRNA (guanine-N(7)-)-methyltransferase [Porphyridium purpureum]|uniref:tRNA (guanine(46)-N(7))-methyltransferase n=1 Tax=Porphyridium purpureum TaxID=35688 RepID=A0A5J4YM91_PORPP|nr:tRNA (guanine-N(7)-)-methyltransferase [Porphyridium purpureum]|eukprot:POR4534..scf249_10